MTSMILRGRRALLALSLTLVALLPLGCEPAAPPADVAAPREPIHLSAQVDRTEATVGDILTYTLALDHDEGLKVPLPDAGSKLRGLAIADIEEPPQVARDGRIHRSRIYHLRADQVGSYRLPEVVLSLGDEEIVAPSIFVEVKSVLEGEDDVVLADIKGPLPVETDNTRSVVALGAALFLLAAAALALYLFRRRGRIAAPAPPPPPPWSVAIDALRALNAQGLAQSGAYRAFAFALSEILRRYIEDRFGAPALEQTSPEILQQLRAGGSLHRQLSPALEGGLGGFLSTTDQSKYAKSPLEPVEAQALMAFAESFVEETTPRAPDPSEDAAPEAGRLKGGAA